MQRFMESGVVRKVLKLKSDIATLIGGMDMEKFCKYCGKVLEEGKLCDCQRSEIAGENLEKNEVEKDIVNSMSGKQYSFGSSTFMSLASLIPYRGKIFTEVDIDDEKMTIKMTPKSKNKIPTIYLKDIKDVTVSIKLSYYLIVCAGVFAALGIGEPICFLFGLFFLWLAFNRKISIILNNGDSAKIYSNSKSSAEEFASELKKVLDL